MAQSAKKLAAVLTVAVFGIAFSAAAIAAPSFKRTKLQSFEFPNNYVTELYLVDIDAGFGVPAHTHPGLETLYVVEGEVDLIMEGQPAKHMKPGDSAQIPIGVVHSTAPSEKPVKVLSTYVVEKGKPLASIVAPK